MSASKPKTIGCLCCHSSQRAMRRAALPDGWTRRTHSGAILITLSRMWMGRSSRRQPTRQTDFVLKLWLSTVTCAGLVTKQDETSRTQEAVPKQISNPFLRKRVHFFGKRTHKNMYPLPSKWMLVFLLKFYTSFVKSVLCSKKKP